MPVYPPFTVLSAPIPPTRARRALFPAGRGRIIVFSCKGLRPLHPRGWVGSGAGGGWKVVFDRGLARGTGRERRVTAAIIRSGKFWGVRGTLSRVPRRISAATQERKKAGTGHERWVTAIINSFGKVLGGSGGLFQESPGVSPYLPVSPPPVSPPAPCKKEGTAHEGRFRGMITRRSDRSARCPAPGSSGRRHTG